MPRVRVELCSEREMRPVFPMPSSRVPARPLPTPDGRAVPVFHKLLRDEGDKKLRLHAGLGLMRCREAKVGDAG